MDDQPAHHGDCIEAQLLSYGRGVVHLQDLASNEKHDAKGEVPRVGRAAGSAPGRQRPWEALGTQIPARVWKNLLSLLFS